MGAGKVDFKNLWKQETERQKRIRWRTLQCRQNGALVSVYGYEVETRGGWFGYTLADLASAPCVHCGQTTMVVNEGSAKRVVPIFRPESWAHECSGFYQGHRLPCAEGIPAGQTSHPCRGEPSMSFSAKDGGPSLWRVSDWFEVQIASK